MPCSLVGTLPPKKRYCRRRLNASGEVLCRTRDRRRENPFFFHITAEMRSVMQSQRQQTKG